MVRRGRQPVKFEYQASPGESGTFTRRLEVPAVVDRMVINSYPGPELDLTLDPFYEDPDDIRVPIFLPDDGGSVKDVLEVNDDDIDLRLWVPLEAESEIGLDFDNKETAYSYDFRVIFMVDWRDPHGA